MARLTRKPLTPTPEEVTGNPRARSAKMRIAEKIGPTSREKAHVS
jgi:16S rRNA (cytosine1402-N4)-methyltransferase